MKDNTSDDSFLNRRILSFILAFVSALMMYAYYRELSLIGFPDGHRTELERAYEKIYPIYVILSSLFMLSFLYLGLAIRRRQNQKKIKWIVVFLIVFIIFTLAINHYLYENLEHGQGG